MLFEQFGDSSNSSSAWVHHAIPSYPLNEGPEFPDDFIVAKRSVLSKVEAGGIPHFYIIELQVSTESPPKSFRVVTEAFSPKPSQQKPSGSSKTEYRICATMRESLAIYGSIFRERESPVYKYSPLLLTGSIGNKQLSSNNTNIFPIFPSSLPEETQDLIKTVYSEAALLLSAQSNSITSLSSVQIDKALSVLFRIKQLIDQVSSGQDANNNQIDGVSALSLTREFFNALPTLPQNGMIVDNSEKLEKMFETCRLLRDVLDMGEATVSFDSNTGDISDVDLLYRSLNCDISVLSTETVEFEIVKQLLQNGEDSSKHNFKLKRVFKIARPMDSSAFISSLPNQRLLFHGTKASNLLGILSRGLLLPDVVTSKYNVSRTNLGLLGAGIYFSEDCSCSFKYTKPTSTSNSRFMLVCNVALGKTFETSAINSALEGAPFGYNSVHGIGRNINPKSDFEDDEFVIYKPSQQIMRYLLEFSLDESQTQMVPRLIPPKQARSAFFHLGIINNYKSKKDVSIGRSQTTATENNTVSKPKKSYGLQTSSGEVVPLEQVNVHASLVDVVAEVTVFQLYSNNSSSPLEAKYVFPLDEMSAVTGFEAFINDKHVIGVVKEKEKAHKEYKEAIERGDGAYLLDEAKDNVFTVSIGNIPPKTKVVIKIIYITELAVDGLTRKFVYPATLVPHQRQTAINSMTQNVTQSISVGTGGSFSLEVAISMPFFVQQVSSPSHTIMCKKSATKATARWIEDQPPAIDFILLVRIADLRLPCMWVEDSSIEDDDERAAMIVIYPNLQQKEDLVSENIIIIDQSNSMQTCLLDTKNTAIGLIHGLPDLSLFNMIAFGSTFESLFVSPKPLNEATKKLALGFCGQMSANWGSSSSLWNALKMLFLEIECRNTKEEQKDMDTNIFLITDGDFSSSEEVCKLVSNHCERTGNRTRIFTFGMGSTPHRHNVSSLSRCGCGAVEFIGPSNPLNEQDKKQIVRASQPSLGSIKISWESQLSNQLEVSQSPISVQSLFSGERTIIYGLIPEECVRVNISAKSSGSSESFSAIASFSPATVTKGLLIHRLFTRAVVRDWEDGKLATNAISSEIEKERLKQYVIDLGCKYSLATPLTSFIAVEERSEAEKQGRVILPPTPPMEILDSIKLDGIPNCSNWEKIEKSAAVTSDSRPKIGSGKPVKHQTVYDYWEAPQDTSNIVTVYSLTGKLIPIPLSPYRNTISIQQIKESIQETEGIPPDQQRLVLGGKVLKDNRNIKAGCHLHLVLRLRGGGGENAEGEDTWSSESDEEQEEQFGGMTRGLRDLHGKAGGKRRDAGAVMEDDGRTCNITLIDTAGQEEYSAMKDQLFMPLSVSASVHAPPPPRESKKESGQRNERKKRRAKREEEPVMIQEMISDSVGEPAAEPPLLPPAPSTTTTTTTTTTTNNNNNAQIDGTLLSSIRGGKSLKKSATSMQSKTISPPPPPPKQSPLPVSKSPERPSPAPRSAGRGAKHSALPPTSSSSMVPMGNTMPCGAPPPPPPPPALSQEGFLGGAVGAGAGGGFYGFTTEAMSMENELMEQSTKLDELESQVDRCAMTFSKKSKRTSRAMNVKSAGMACFIATAAYGTVLDPHIDSLRWFRDNVLDKFELGREFTRNYYKYSPPFAKWLTTHDNARAIVRTLLWPLVFMVDYPIPILLCSFSVILFWLIILL